MINFILLHVFMHQNDFICSKPFELLLFCYYIPLWLLPFHLQTSSIVLSSTIVNVLIYSSSLQLLLDLQKPSSDYRNLNHSSLFKRTKWWTCYIKQEEQGEKKAKSKWKCFRFTSIPWNLFQKTLPIELGIWKDSCIHYSKEKRNISIHLIK